jgi:hypothetical protein
MMRESTQEAVVATVMQYVEAWNEADAAIRLIMLERCWADDATYVDPNVELSGRVALCAHISKVQSGRSGAWIEMMSGIDVHHNVIRFLWRVVRADGSAGDTSIDFGKIDSGGKLTRIVGFFGEAPQR